MRRQCDGATCHYLGNGSAVDIARQMEQSRKQANLVAARWREVSRGRSTAIGNRGAGIRPFKLGNPPARSGKDRTDKGQSDRVEDSEAIATDRWCAELRASAMGSMGLPGQADSACSRPALVAGSDRNRRIRSRMSGGVGPVAG